VAIGPELDDRALGAFVERFKLPVVAIEPDARVVSCDVVRSAGDLGIGSLVELLADLGHRTVAFIDTPQMPASRLRRQGYLDGVSDRGIAADVITIEGGYTEEAGAAAAAVILAREVLPTAVIAGNDQAAAGFVLAVNRAGVRVPEEVSVAGYDDSRFASRGYADLTTIRVDPDGVAAAVVDSVLRRIERPGAPPMLTVVPTELVVRSSTGHLRAIDRT
jgi:DNA-binding LacI/PurR family transcriptional regulator